ncbi:MAG: hypothetical protein K9J21_07655 [Bacteroidales bacterium]|nr:hypothetical protein [Bacteroidales bacterium]
MKRGFVVIMLFALIVNVNGQTEDVEFSGYIKSLQTVINPSDQTFLQDEIFTDNLLHNRLNFAYYPNNQLNFTLEGRNRLMFGELVKLMNGLGNSPNRYAEMLNKDDGFLDLSESIFYGNGYILHSMVDRMYVDYTINNWHFRAGRQRINWGINMIWNPNDIFNTFNYFDFDYEERPGTDAMKVQYYTSPASSAEIVWQAGKDWNEMAIAGMYRFNKFGYDWQFLGGYKKRDAIIGAGWTGHIGGAGFRGEATWFQHEANLKDTTGQLVASVSVDYMFPNSFYLNGGFLYNSEGTKGKASRSQMFMTNQDLSVKTLTPSKSEVFLQMSYPVTPLLHADISTIINPFDGSWFSGPTVTYSLGQNLDVMVTSQLFFGEENTEYGDVGQLYYLRLKYNF